MRLAAPWGLAALGLAVPLVVWYLLRSRRPRQVVASTFLWRQADRTVAAAVPWQRFRGDVTFWLLLLAIVAGALALAQPYVPVAAALGDHTVLIVDASASMLADEDGPTRLELARREAADLVARLGPGQEVSVVEAGTRARVLLSSSADPAAIRDALASVRPTHGGADLVDAFTLAAALERPGQVTVTHLLTDGAVPPDAAAAVPEGLQVLAVGSERPNLAVSGLQAVPVGAGTSQVFVQVRNLGALPARARLILSVGAQDVMSEALDLGPRGTEDRVLTVPGGAGEILSARVEPVGTELTTGGPAADALSVDDRAYAVLASTRELAIVVAGPGNVFLEAAFGAVPGATVTTAPSVPTDLDGVDLLVVDRVPAPAAPTVPTLLVAPTAWPAGISTAEDVELPSLTFQSPGHELLADVDLSEVAVAAATVVTAPALTTVAGGPDTPLLLAGRLDGTPVVALAFDLLASNLPLLPAWPVLAANTVTWLAGPAVSPPVLAGDELDLRPPAGTASVSVEPPSGAAIALDPARPRTRADTVGVWRARYDDAEPVPLAVNPDVAESDLSRPRPDPVELRAEAETSAAPAAEGRRPFGPELLLAVLALALAEWLWVYAVRPWRRRRAAVPA